MKIKLHQKDTSRLLWRNSPCTLRCVIQNPSMDNAKRFHYGSIYFKDQVNKPKKVFTQFQKPQLLLLNFRRQLQEVTIRAKKGSSVAQNTSNISRDRKISKKNTSPLDVKLYKRPPKIQLRHDRFGNRSSYHGEYDVRQMTQRMKQSKRNFYSSQRMDLSKPINFYPGPGTYFKQQSTNFKQSNQRQMRHTFSQRLKSSSLVKAI